MLIGFEHVGITVGDMDRAIGFYCGLLGLRLAMRTSSAGGELAFLDAGGGMLEVAAPVPAAGRFRDVPMSEAGMRHLTFAFDDVDGMIETLEAEGIEIVERPRKAYNTEMVRRVAFVRDPDGILVELVERAPGR
ncbi:glyoxylase I family protein [Devosia lucknowensis]|uniref:Glyoxylase I family protein n=1 Tax=Devosia lucknowensis TaxID=1096929 RepID=A0A1Y6EKA7_9HYPH|nr:VOC family protein [Devosia lucknowensis]SMQ61350.1 glyoxylase I family protein [Devosia lucknowensis]